MAVLSRRELVSFRQTRGQFDNGTTSCSNLQTNTTEHGRRILQPIGCAQRHVPDLLINYDRRVADVETNYDPVNGL